MNQILIYQREDGSTKLDVRLENQTVWLNQKQLTELFGKAKGTISEHIKHIFEDKELEEDSVVRLFRTTACGCHRGTSESFSSPTQQPRWRLGWTRIKRSPSRC